MRMFIKLGAPLEFNGVRYLNKMDRIEEQDAYVLDFYNDIIDNMKEKYKEDKTGFKIYQINQLVFLQGVADTLWGGMIFISCSIVFVYGYFVYHLGSVFLASLGLFLIALSFPLTVIITNGVF